MAVTRDDVKSIAALARLYIPEAEEASLTDTLNSILGYFDKLSELDTSGVEPLTHILPVENVMREDVRGDSVGQETALANAPEHDRGHFVIPRVIE